MNSRDRQGGLSPRRILEVLATASVDYIVIGGLAVIAHGHTRNTRDVDFLAEPTTQNFERLARALRELGARLSGTDAHLLGIDIYDPVTLANGANFTMETIAGGLDFFSEVPGADSYPRMRARALTVDLGDLKIVVAGKEDLIRMKMAAGREQDLADVAVLTAAPEEREA